MSQSRHIVSNLNVKDYEVPNLVTPSAATNYRLTLGLVVVGMTLDQIDRRRQFHRHERQGPGPRAGDPQGRTRAADGAILRGGRQADRRVDRQQQAALQGGAELQLRAGPGSGRITVFPFSLVKAFRGRTVDNDRRLPFQPLLDVRAVALYLGLTTRTVRNLIARREFPKGHLVTVRARRWRFAEVRSGSIRRRSPEGVM